MSAEKITQVKNTKKEGVNEKSADTDCSSMAAQFALITTPIVSNYSVIEGESISKISASSEPFKRVRCLIEGASSTIEVPENIERLCKLFSEKHAEGMHRFSIELPNEKPINVTTAMSHGCCHVTLATASRNMRRRLEKNKNSMERTISGQLLSPVKISFES